MLNISFIDLRNSLNVCTPSRVVHHQRPVRERERTCTMHGSVAVSVNMGVRVSALMSIVVQIPVMAEPVNQNFASLSINKVKQKKKCTNSSAATDCNHCTIVISVFHCRV